MQFLTRRFFQNKHKLPIFTPGTHTYLLYLVAPIVHESAKAHQRLEKFGLNEPIRLQRSAGLRQFLVFLANPLVVILLIASIVIAALGEVLNASIIVAMVLLSIALNFVQTFRSQGFVESLATQTLVLFIIRTAGNPLRSRPSLPLAITTILVVCTGIILPFTPLAGPLGFTPLPPLYFLFLTGMIIAYLLLVEIVKRRLMSRLMR